MKVLRTLQKIGRICAGPVYRHIRSNRVVMFHGGRSGSTVLGYLLHDHPQIFWAGELLARRSLERYRKKRPSITYPAIIREAETRTFKQIFGFEMKFMHLADHAITAEQFLAQMEKSGYRHFIILTRKNVLRREVSSQISRVAGYTQIPKDRNPELNRTKLDADKLISTLDAYHANVGHITTLLREKHYLLLNYEEDIEQDPLIAYGKICQFLRLPLHPVQPRIRRVNPFPLREMIENYDEVEAILRGTKYAWMLDA